MRKAFIAFGMLLMTAGTAHAGGLVHKMSSSVQLTVDTARTTATRLGSQYSISGSNVNTTDGTTAGTITTGTLTSGIYGPGDISATQATAGEAFSFSKLNFTISSSTFDGFTSLKILFSSSIFFLTLLLEARIILGIFFIYLVYFND